MAMSIGSPIIAGAPDYATIGVFAPIMLIFAPFLQALSMGCQYGTSTTCLSEISPEHRRGVYLVFCRSAW
ncbi:MFS transporter [Caballeronia fortuita]|uniref:MFS transporter n=1 Tax=Caballeronia fortuita TaxID=1777138 RepID=A0A158CX06_9BURK|nr:MFS transporter [Caballeronia fortuita]SAK86466.1 MFS transporter [Caballeronia fortuita]